MAAAAFVACAGLAGLAPGRRPRRDGGRAGFFIGLFCEGDCGLELDPALLAAAARLGIGLDLALYPADPPEDRTAAAD